MENIFGFIYSFNNDVSIPIHKMCGGRTKKRSKNRKKTYKKKKRKRT